MTSMCLKPGINNIYINTDYADGPILVLKKEENNRIHLNFSLTGMNNLRSPINSKLQPFYLYILLTYQHGGKETEVISSSQIRCDQKILENESLDFKSTLPIPLSKVYTEFDFILNFYSVKIAYFEREAEDGSDLNFLLNDPYCSLFSTKLNIEFKGE
ncbi:hypothetical protein [Virgibacillus dokdonensis]|uniref:Uncharacterized protein n=1 Tax=Virgibacillus dokdonensis TaxID=302167 RepID=A0A2K9IZP6_9BACI|nr:hypothetical protein [Virgibacillus dokdonensis]AUJ25149.1 hypothetical protein A21D_02085 [Virgibacillus dokdonensis]